jgi:hypothetical protein
MKNLRLLLTISILAATPLRANAELPTAQFLLEGQGPRATAMGGAVVADCNDYSAWYWNPANAASAKATQLGFNGENITANVSSSYVSFLYPAKRFTLGLQLLSENSSVKAYDNTGLRQPSINNQNIIENIGFAMRLNDNLALGMNVGQVSMSVGGYKTNSAMNMAFGTLYSNDRFSAGVVVANIGDKLSIASGMAQSQPLLARYGMSYRLLADKNLVCSVSKQNVLASEALGSVSAGAEYTMNRLFSLRCGILNQNGFVRLSYGFGIAYKNTGLDFTYVLAPEELQGMDTIQFGFSYKFKTEVVSVETK